MISFSYRTRNEAFQAFEKSSVDQPFDLLIVGGGITGVAVARDAVMRGLSVALVEKNDFASGTSSKSSKLVHGGLRYLEQREFKLVFEALAERALLLKNSNTTVRPLPFYFPVYQTDKRGMTLLSLGLWLYDFLSLFRTPGFHRRLSRKKMLRAIPDLKADGLKGGFRYYDASMWDDLMVIEIVRDAIERGAKVAHYCEAVTAIWGTDAEGKKQIRGYSVRDVLSWKGSAIHARQVVVCVGPWTDQFGKTMGPDFRPWLAPSRGTHLVFDSKRLPVPGALVMATEQDGRIAFVIPRPDFGSGVTVVGTTDGPSALVPDTIDFETRFLQEDTSYLLKLLEKYFPKLGLNESDILSAYIGIRPLVSPERSIDASAESLQKLSREHHIDWGPGGTLMVAGGKYTTHRTMAEEIVDFALQNSEIQVRANPGPAHSQTPFFPASESRAIQLAQAHARKSQIQVPQELWSRMGAEALRVVEIHCQYPKKGPNDPEGFPMLEAQLRYSIRHEGVMTLRDFVFRRVPLFLSRADHGMPWWWALATVWAEEMGGGEVSGLAEKEWALLDQEVKKREAWRNSPSL